MSLLTVVQNACAEMGYGPPNAAAGSNDLMVIQLVALAKREGNELSTGATVGLNYDWTVLQTEATWTTVAANLQGSLPTLAPGFKYIINDSIWDRTQQRAFPGPLSASQWQWRKAAVASGPYPEWRIINNSLYMIPAPTAGHTGAFEYQSSYWAQDSGGTNITAYSVDTDTARLDENLITMGLIWRFKKSKGLDYAEEFRSYQTAAINAISRDGGRHKLSLSDSGRLAPPLSVPDGNWVP